ncbi:hypothetical protein COBT_002962 [Conglomerata obtusa]
MILVYIFLLVWSNELHAIFVNNYIPDEVITRLTQIENTVESQLEIRNKNQYNEYFTLTYHVKNVHGYEKAYNIIKRYLNAYDCFYDKNKYCVTTLNSKYFEFMQNVARLYKRKAGRKSLEYNKMHMYTSDRVLDNIKDKFATSRYILVDNCLINDQDFALCNYNLRYTKYKQFIEEEHYIFINLKFHSSSEKQNWLIKHPFRSFFDKHDFLDDFDLLISSRHETFFSCEYVYDETKYYHYDELFFHEGDLRHDFFGSKRLDKLKHSIIRDDYSFRIDPNQSVHIISNSYFLVFRKNKDPYNEDFTDNLLEKSKKGEFISKNQIQCCFYGKFIDFLLLRYKNSIHLEEFPKNDNLFEIFLDIIIVKNDTIIGEITIKYIAHSTDINSFYMPAYMFKKFKGEIIDYETKFNAFLIEVKKYFSQSFSDYDENKRLCINI